MGAASAGSAAGSSLMMPPAAFQRSIGGVEPFVGRIARLSLAHRDGAVSGAVETAAATLIARTTPSMLPKDVDYIPATSKSWTPAPAIPLPCGVTTPSKARTMAQDGASPWRSR